MAGLDERLDDLFGEEGVPRGARVDRLGQAVGLGSLPSRSASSSRIASGSERQQRQLVVPRLLHPRGAVLGTEVDDQEMHACRPIASTHSSIHASLAPSIQCRSSIRITTGAPCDVALGEPPQDAEELPLARLRDPCAGPGSSDRARRRSRTRIGRTSTVLLVEQQHAPGDLLAHLLVRVLLGDAVVLAEHLQDREERDVLAVRDTAAEARGAPPRGSARGTRSTAGSCPTPASATTPTTWPLPARTRARARRRGSACRRRGRRSASGRGRARRRSGCGPRRGPGAGRPGPGPRRPSRRTARDRRA